MARINIQKLAAMGFDKANEACGIHSKKINDLQTPIDLRIKHAELRLECVSWLADKPEVLEGRCNIRSFNDTVNLFKTDLNELKTMKTLNVSLSVSRMVKKKSVVEMYMSAWEYSYDEYVKRSSRYDYAY